MADRFGSNAVERALVMQEGSVLANEVLQLRTERDMATEDAGKLAAEVRRLRVEVRQLRDAAPYIPCECGRRIYIPAALRNLDQPDRRTSP